MKLVLGLILITLFMTVSMAFASTCPLIIGHRGLGQFHSPEPENSIPALMKAFTLGVDAVEFDVQLSKDRQIVLAHDPRLERMTNGKGCVSETNFDALRALHLKDYSGNVHADLQPATLKEALMAIRPFDNPSRPILAVIHIKSYDHFHGDWVSGAGWRCDSTDYQTLTLQVFRTVKRLQLLDRVMFASFDKRVLEILREHDSSLNLGDLGVLPNGALHRAEEFSDGYVLLNTHFISKKRVAKVHQNRLKVLVWSPEKFNQMLTELVDGTDGEIVDDVPAGLNAAHQFCR